MCENLISKFSNSWDNIQINNLENNDINDLIIKNIETAASETLPETVEQKLQWQNDEKLRELYSKKDELFKKNANPKGVQKLRKQIRKRSRQLRNEMNTSRPKLRNLTYLLQQENLTNYSPLLKDKLRL